jgi:uridine phosphorylase
MPDFAHRLIGVQAKGLPFTNMEMETSALYALSRLLGHRALSLSVVIANRPNKTFSKDHRPAMEKLIETVLERVNEL